MNNSWSFVNIHVKGISIYWMFTVQDFSFT